MPDQKKKSPWVKDEAHPADLPQEVYEDHLGADDTRLERDIVAARLASTPVPPPSEWKTCWACGKKVPLLMRDPMLGILVCRACAWTSFLQDFLSSVEGMFGGIGDFLSGGVAPEDDDEPEDDEPEDDEPEDDEPGLDIEGEDEPSEPMPISPSAVEADGGPSAKAGEDEDEPQEPSEEDE